MLKISTYFYFHCFRGKLAGLVFIAKRVMHYTRSPPMAQRSVDTLWLLRVRYFLAPESLHCFPVSRGIKFHFQLQVLEMSRSKFFEELYGGSPAGSLKKLKKYMPCFAGPSASSFYS